MLSLLRKEGSNTTLHLTTTTAGGRSRAEGPRRSLPCPITWSKQKKNPHLVPIITPSPSILPIIPHHHHPVITTHFIHYPNPFSYPHMRTGRAAFISFLSAMILAATAIILFFALRGIHAADHSFTNPIKRHNGSDPYITRIHDDWYLMTTTYTELQITKANTLHDLKDAKTKTVWKGTSPEYCCNIGTVSTRRQFSHTTRRLLMPGFSPSCTTSMVFLTSTSLPDPTAQKTLNVHMSSQV